MTALAHIWLRERIALLCTPGSLIAIFELSWLCPDSLIISEKQSRLLDSVLILFVSISISNVYKWLALAKDLGGGKCRHYVNSSHVHVPLSLTLTLLEINLVTTPWSGIIAISNLFYHIYCAISHETAHWWSSTAVIWWGWRWWGRCVEGAQPPQCSTTQSSHGGCTCGQAFRRERQSSSLLTEWSGGMTLAVPCSSPAGYSISTNITRKYNSRASLCKLSRSQKAILHGATVDWSFLCQGH